MLVTASGGHNTTKDAAIIHLLHVLNSVHLDQLEGLLYGAPFPEATQTAASLLDKKAGATPVGEQAASNRMLLASRVAAQNAIPSPGSIFLQTAVANALFDYVGIRAAHKGDFFDPKSVQKLQGQLGEDSTLALLEVTPGCDFAQNKQPVYRVLVGLLVKDRSRSHLKRAPYLKIIEPILCDVLADLEGIASLVLNSRLLLALRRRS